MKFTLRLASCLLLALIPPAAVQAQTADSPGTEAARVIVRFKPGVAVARALAAGRSGELRHAAALSQRVGITLADGRSIDERTQVVHASGMSSQALVQRLAQDAEVESVVIDQRRHLLAAPNDPFYAPTTVPTNGPASGQWYLHAPDNTVVSAINAEAAWALTTGSSSVVVAVLDTGVRFDHPDFGANLLLGYDMISDAAMANNGGQLRHAGAADPGDWVSQADINAGTLGSCTSADIGDSSWHGTQTAGLIGALTDNGVGMASVGRNVSVLPVRVLGKCGGFDSDIQAAMRWAVGLAVPGVPVNTTPAKVISMSLGAAGTCGSNTNYPTVITAVLATGAVIVASAGNDGLAVNEPANCSGVVAVAGLRQTGTKVGYSSLGPQVTIGAPAGNCVNTSGTCLYPLLTTTNSGTTVPSANTYSSGSAPSIGTSFSAPLVSGTLALMFSANPALTRTQAISALRSAARAFPSSGAGTGVAACQAPSATAQDSECYCTTSTCGAGMLDAGAAVAAAVALVPATASIVPSATSVTAGTAVTLDGSGSTAASGRTIASYRWAITVGSGLASFSGAVDAATASLATTGAGTVTVSLTVTDSAGGIGTASQSITVAAVPGTTPPAAAGGGGGGSLDLRWLLLLCGAVFALRRAPGRRGR